MDVCEKKPDRKNYVYLQRLQLHEFVNIFFRVALKENKILHNLELITLFGIAIHALVFDDI